MADFVGLRYASGQDALATSFAFSPTSNCLTGNMLILSVATAAAGPRPVIVVTDTQLNTWKKIACIDPNIALTTFSSYLEVGLTTSDTITLTITNNITNPFLVVTSEFTGVTLPKDTELPTDVAMAKTAISAGGPWSIGPTPSTSYPAELVIGTLYQDRGVASSFTVGSGYTLAGTASNSFGVMGMEYKLVTTTGTQTADCTFSDATTLAQWYATIVSLIIDTPQGAPPPLLG